MPAFAISLMTLGATAATLPSAEAYWFGNYKKGSLLEARRACANWSDSQGQLTIRPIIPGITSWPQDVNIQVAWNPKAMAQ